MTRVLLVSHEASRTGAPRIAAIVASCLVDEGHVVRIVSQRPGPLVAEFAAVAPTRVEPLWRVRRRLWSRPGRVRQQVARMVELVVAAAMLLVTRPDLVYVNSTSAAGYVRVAKLFRRSVVLHVHESGAVLDGFLSRAGVNDLRSAPMRLVACSPSVHAALIERGARPETIDLLLSIPDADAVRAGAASSVIPPAEQGQRDVVVGCCGAIDYRKGVDLWLEVARRVCAAESGASFHFVWVGDGDPPALSADLDRVKFAGPTNNPAAAMRGFDIMTLPSRDDPFPLVVMEAMLLARPVVAFDVGGVAHQLGDTGVLVCPGDVDTFAREVILLGADPARRARLGTAAAERAESLFSRRTFATGLKAVLARAMIGAGTPAFGA